MSQCYRQLRLDEREALFRMKDARLPISRIAEQLGLHPSPVYRDLRRNFFYDEDSYFRGYFPSIAHKLASHWHLPSRLSRSPGGCALPVKTTFGSGMRRSTSMCTAPKASDRSSIDFCPGLADGGVRVGAKRLLLTQV